jgi:F-type H+-transporting ATPase subunit epsilon
MSSGGTFRCSVVTPERVVLECDARFVAFTAHDGELGVLRNRAPLVCRVGIGALRIEGPGVKHHFFVDGGFAQVVDNRLTILTAQARRTADIDPAVAQRALVEARALPARDAVTMAQREDAMTRARVQLRLVERGAGTAPRSR